MTVAQSSKNDIYTRIGWCLILAVSVSSLGSGGSGRRFRDTDPVVLELCGLEPPDRLTEAGREEPERLLLLVALDPLPSSSL